MDAEHPLTVLDRLAPAATRPERLRARLRVGVGGAIVLMLAALVVTVLVAAFGQQASSTVSPADMIGAAAAPTPFGSAGASVDTADPTGSPTVLVHVLGAVVHPGVVELSGGARVRDAIAAVGGLTATADPAGANLARLVTDGEQIYLPQQGELPAGAPPGIAAGSGAGSGAGASAVAGAIVNLNSASLADLETLPRIGPTMAQRILDYRTSNGPFTVVDDLRNVTGIGERTFEALRDLVRV